MIYDLKYDITSLKKKRYIFLVCLSDFEMTLLTTERLSICR